MGLLYNSINHTKIDSILRKDLQNKGILTSYYFQHKKKDSIIFSNKMATYETFPLVSEAKSTFLKLFTGLYKPTRGTLIIDETENSVSLYPSVKKINDTYAYEEKIELLSILWELVKADSKVDAFEENLYFKIAGLIKIKRSTANQIKQKSAKA